MTNLWIKSQDGSTIVAIFMHDVVPFDREPRFTNLKSGWYWHRVADTLEGYIPADAENPSGPFETRGAAVDDAAGCCFD